MKHLRTLSILLFALLVIAADVNGFWKVAAKEVPGIPVYLALQDTTQSNPKSANVAGNWTLSWKGRKGKSGRATLQIQQESTRLTGTVDGNDSLSLTGSVQGNKVSFTQQSQEGKKSPTFTGTVNGDTMSGTTQEGLSWTATRQQE